MSDRGDTSGEGRARGRGRWRWIVNLLYAGVLAVAAIAPQVPTLPGVEAPDWLGHGVAYGIQGALLMWARLPSAGLCRSAVTGVVGATAFGAATEYLQRLTPARSAELADLGANALGAAVGCGLLAAVSVLAARRKSWDARS